MTEKLKNQMRFLAEADKMKGILRQTRLADGTRQENDAEHSWHFALTAMTLYEYCGIGGVNIDRVVKMAILHDLVEIYAGDTFAYDTIGNQSKEARERESADRLFALLPEGQAAEYRSLWEEFELMQTPDAIYASAIDRLQSLHNIHLSGGYTWEVHGVTADKIYERMAPVKTALPQLWEYVENTVDEGLTRGYIKNITTEDLPC